MTEAQELKLRWLVLAVDDSHHKCEYRQDGTERSSVRCGGCSHSSHSFKKAVDRVIDYVSKIEGM